MISAFMERVALVVFLTALLALCLGLPHLAWAVVMIAAILSPA